VACMGEGSGIYTAFVGGSGGKRSPRRSRFRWEGNIKMLLRETGMCMKDT
jgi:hypothetical protein